MQHSKEKELVHRLKYNFREEVVDEHRKRFYNTHIMVNLLSDPYKYKYVITVHPILYDRWAKKYYYVSNDVLMIDKIISTVGETAEALCRYIIQYATDLVPTDNGFDYYYMNTPVLFLYSIDNGFHRKQNGWFDSSRPLVSYDKADKEELSMEGII